MRDEIRARRQRLELLQAEAARMPQCEPQPMQAATAATRPDVGPPPVVTGKGSSRAWRRDIEDWLWDWLRATAEQQDLPIGEDASHFVSAAADVGHDGLSRAEPVFFGKWSASARQAESTLWAQRAREELVERWSRSRAPIREHRDKLITLHAHERTVLLAGLQLERARLTQEIERLRDCLRTAFVDERATRRREAAEVARAREFRRFITLAWRRHDQRLAANALQSSRDVSAAFLLGLERGLASKTHNLVAGDDT